MPHPTLERVYGNPDTSAETIFLEGEDEKVLLVRHGTKVDGKSFAVGSESSISRQHATLAVRDKFWIILDHSSNGTCLNGGRVPQNEPWILFPGDEIDFVKQSRYRFQADPPMGFKKMALITGHYNGHKYSGVINNAYALRKPLEKRGFQGGVKVLLDQFANRSNILSHLELVLPSTSHDSIFIFYFSGHANENANLILGDEALDAYSLFARLGDFRGKVLLILDGCYTESFSQASLPPNCSLIGNSAKGYEGMHSHLISLDNDSVKHRIAGNLTMAIVRVLEENPNGISFEDLLTKVRSNLENRASLRKSKAQAVFLLGPNNRVDTEVVSIK